jgi:transcriptional regulator with XRE-family HTH domain
LGGPVTRKTVHNERYKRLIAALKAGRLKAGITQTELARILLRPQSYVAKYERGERRLDVVEFVEISTAIKTDAAKLLSKIFSLHG